MAGNKQPIEAIAPPTIHTLTDEVLADMRQWIGQSLLATKENCTPRMTATELVEKAQELQAFLDTPLGKVHRAIMLAQLGLPVILPTTTKETERWMMA